MKNKGFTLIELLAVIVIIALIAVITVPIVVGIIDRARISSYKESVRSVFEAANIYIASQEFTTFPEEGINVTDSVIRLKNNNFTSGKIIMAANGKLELEKVSNGRYCAGGTNEEIVVIEGSCDQLDVTPPTVSLTSNLVTSSSITVVAVGEDLESGINGYQFSKDNGTTWTNKQTSNVYSFNGLINNTNYTFSVRAINNNQLSTISDSITIKTIDIPIPTYSISTTNWIPSATVTITYPTRETGYIYQYSLDNALTWLTVDTPAVTKDITFTDNGSVIARILDGTNEISGTSYTVANIDRTNPTATINVVGTPFNGGGWANANFNVTVSGIDNESGVKSYTYCQTTSASCTPVTVVNAVSGTVTISTESATNKVCAISTDNANNNSSVVCSNVYKLDKTNPSIVFSMNGNATYAKSRSTTVTVSDTNSGVLSSSLEYQWTTTTTTPTEASFTTTFTSGGTISTPAGVTGGYYLWILSKDNAGNTIITRSNVFNLDNIIPVITVNPTTVSITLGSTYTDTGVTASDNIDGNITASIVKTGTVNTAVSGTYILTYNISDIAGNVADTKTRTVTVIQVVSNFSYNGGVQTFTAPATGTYRFEVWGAQGGNNGGRGGYATGQMSLTANQQLSIIVGGAGSDYYGGVGTLNGSGGGGGGGGSFIRNGSTVLIAGGGGGGAAQGAGGAGGGTTGLNGTSAGSTTAGTGGTQSSGGIGGNTPNSDYGNGGGYGYGGGSKRSGSGTPFSTGGIGGGAGGFGGGGASATNYSDGTTGGGGGGGYYGGGAGGSYYTSSGGGGGSSYVGSLTSTQTIAGNTTMPNPSGGNETGHAGNGYIRITFIP